MYIASASTTVKFHEFPNSNVAHHYQPGYKVEGSIRSISWNRFGNWLAIVPHSGLTDIVQVKDELKLVRTIQDVQEPTCAAFSNTTKKLLAIGTKGGQVLVYDVKSRNTQRRFPRSSSSISHVDFTGKDTHCIAGCINGDILVYSNTTNNVSCTFRVPKSRSVTCLKANQFRRNLILGGSNEGIVVVWDSNVNKVKFFVEAHKAPVTSVAFSPVNTDLIVSTALDRQFCFYDITDHKCIASVSVENSITSVDFSPEGTYFVMGSHNGKVYIYDSRNIQDPVHAFSVHSNAVKHLLFQRYSENTANTSCSSISSDNAIAAPSSEESMNRHSDLSGLFIQLPSTDLVESMKTSNSMEAGDSFIAALGLDKNTTDSLRQDECHSTKKRMDSRVSPISMNHLKSTHEKIGDVKSSTPKFLPQSMKNNLSPILNNTESQATACTSADVQAAVKEAIKEELKGALEEVRADIKFQSTHITYQMRRMLLDLQMVVVKEFIKVENYLNTIRDDLNADSPRQVENNYLLEENEMLKKRIEDLEQQVAVLSASENSQ